MILFFTIIISIYNNLNTPYYHIIDENDYDNFLLIKENSPRNVTVLSDPWKARALAPIAEKVVFAVIPFGPDEKQTIMAINAMKFLNENCSNIRFLQENNISIVYTNDVCKNPYLQEFSDNIYFYVNED